WRRPGRWRRGLRLDPLLDSSPQTVSRMLKLRPRTANAADTSRIHVFRAALVAAALRVPYGARGLLAIVAWLGATAWYRPLTLPDEGRYVGVVWEMLRSGNSVVPTLNGMPFFHKPPLFYW